MTAKATQFGRKNFTSWLIESAGTVPLMRRKDAPDGTVDNSHAMKYLVEVMATDMSPGTNVNLSHRLWKSATLYAYSRKG